MYICPETRPICRRVMGPVGPRLTPSPSKLTGFLAARMALTSCLASRTDTTTRVFLRRRPVTPSTPPSLLQLYVIRSRSLLSARVFRRREFTRAFSVCCCCCKWWCGGRAGEPGEVGDALVFSSSRSGDGAPLADVGAVAVGAGVE